MNKICEHVKDENINNNPDFKFIKELLDLSHEWLYLFECRKCGTMYLYYCQEFGFEKEWIRTTIVSVGKKKDINYAEAMWVIDKGMDLDGNAYEKRVF